MLSRKEIKDTIVREELKEMFDEISIPDFYKCIAQFSGLSINRVSDQSVLHYLQTWAINKYEYYKMLGNHVRKDIPVTYADQEADYKDKYIDLAKEYPAFYPWLEGFDRHKTNKADRQEMSYDFMRLIERALPNKSVEGMGITRIFKSLLNAPDELVTAIGAIYENREISATYTISIDPVDMMLASENPYGWTSCYRLELDNSDSHGDGCLAAVLDTSSLITYLWNNEGKFSLYGNYELKSVRYKRMRRWISISPSFQAIHFNTIYPGKNNYDVEFDKTLRTPVEDVVASYLSAKEEREINNVWVKAENDMYVSRVFYYGYGEYEDYYVWALKGAEGETWNPFDVEIECPCGCGNYLPQSDDQDRYHYNGEGFIEENYIEEYYCEYCDDYCNHPCNGEECEGCSCWDDAHPVCELDEGVECDNIDYDESYDGVMHCTPDNCDGCPLYKQHHPDEAEDEDDRHEENILYVRPISHGEAQCCSFVTTNATISCGDWSARL